MKTDRNFSDIDRRVLGANGDGQNIQQFISDSPWEAQIAIRQVQREIASTPKLEKGGVLILDESPEEKAGAQSAGAGRQHNGRLGKIEMSQVGVFVANYKAPSVWTWVDGELFWPGSWFSPDRAEDRRKLGIPPDRWFATKGELGWELIQRVHTHGLPFDAAAFDDIYGRSG
jgi:SRSO17 transposase